MLQQTRDAIEVLPETGLSILGMSHRSDWFREVLDEAEHNLRELLEIPDDYHVLFMQGVLTCHLFEAGYGEAQVDGLMEVQAALDRGHRKAVDTNVWGVDEATFELLADLLVLHEEQLRGAPLNVVAKWNDKMEQGGKASAARSPSMRTVA